MSYFKSQESDSWFLQIDKIKETFEIEAKDVWMEPES